MRISDGSSDVCSSDLLSARDFFPNKVIMKIHSTTAVMSLAMAVTQAMAQSGPRMLVSNVEPAAQAGTMLVEVTVLNPGPEPKQNDLPDRIPAALTVDNRSTSVMLERAIPSPKQTIQPGGFEQAKYLLRLPAESRVRGAMILSLTTDGAQGYAFSPPDPKALNMASKTEARQPAVKASLAALAS